MQGNSLFRRRKPLSVFCRALSVSLVLWGFWAGAGAMAGQVSVLPPATVVPLPRPAPAPVPVPVPAPVSPAPAPVAPITGPASPALPQISPVTPPDSGPGNLRSMDVMRLTDDQAREALGLIDIILANPDGVSPGLQADLRRHSTILRDRLQD